MMVTVKSFAKINLGLRIGPAREDGFHELRTVYQTIGLYDVIRVTVGRGSGIKIESADPRVPRDESNTCYRVVEKAMAALNAKGHVVIEVEKRLPIQGGLGGASANAAAALLALERAVRKMLSPAEKLQIAAEVGSDLPLFLVGGAVLGVGRGEQVYPLEDFPATACVLLTPAIGVSTPKAFAEWDRIQQHRSKLTLSDASDRMNVLGHDLSTWLSELYSSAPSSFMKRGGRAGNPLLRLDRAGIKNDFEQVVFPEYPELGEAKRALMRAGAKYASLSGSGSTLYGLFASRQAAVMAVTKLRKAGWAAQATSTLPRQEFWRRVFKD
jgi:4-diphosphocytidyl-2-C-methyl-D-erythritol kinase